MIRKNCKYEASTQLISIFKAGGTKINGQLQLSVCYLSYPDLSFVYVYYTFTQNSICMFVVIGIMFAGIAAGYLFRRLPLLQQLGKPISYTILLLLLLLGISVGSNDNIINNLSTLGGEAFLLALAATLGSVLAAWGVYNVF